MAETAESIRADALKELERWNAIRKNGSNDPFWPDGVNLNLVRNHIIYANRHLKELSSVPVQLSMFGGCEKLLDDGSANLVPPSAGGSQRLHGKKERDSSRRKESHLHSRKLKKPESDGQERGPSTSNRDGRLRYHEAILRENGS